MVFKVCNVCGDYISCHVIWKRYGNISEKTAILYFYLEDGGIRCLPKLVNPYQNT